MENALKLAEAFRQKKHFSNEAWLHRGLNPSPADVCSRLTLLLIRSTDQFIAAIEAQASPDELRAVLKKGLDSFSESYFDTLLRIHIMQKAAGIPAGWVIASCNTCQELNLLDFKEGTKEMKFENYQSEKTVSADEFTREEALNMLNEMK